MVKYVILITLDGHDDIFYFVELDEQVSRLANNELGCLLNDVLGGIDKKKERGFFQKIKKL